MQGFRHSPPISGWCTVCVWTRCREVEQSGVGWLSWHLPALLWGVVVFTDKGEWFLLRRASSLHSVHPPTRNDVI